LQVKPTLVGLDEALKGGPMAKLKPMLLGRTTRVLFGLGTIVLVVVIGPSTLTTWGTIALVVLGMSFLIGGIVGNPGCELTAIPNLFLPKEKKIHCL
jgi:hypothetical protein